jgi:hypothetical protein
MRIPMIDMMGTPLNILVVDDELNIRKTLAVWLPSAISRMQCMRLPGGLSTWLLWI